MLEKKLASKENALRCSDCLYYKVNKKPGKKCCCSDEGVKPFAKAPACFFPDVTQITKTLEAFSAVVSVYEAFTPKQRRILVSLLQNAGKTNKKEHKFGHKVYIPARDNGEYLSDWAAAYVLGYSPDKKVVISGSPDRKVIGRSFVAYLDPESVYSREDFEKIKAKLVKGGKINNPKLHERKKRISSVDQHEPEIPTMDSVPSSWHTKTDKPKKIKGATQRKDSYDRIVTVLTL